MIRPKPEFTNKDQSKQKPSEIVESAEDFFETAKRCGMTSRKRLLYFAQTVNLAIACELYLKAILLKTNKSYDIGHDIDKYYEKLPDTSKRAIEDEYLKEQKKWSKWITGHIEKTSGQKQPKKKSHKIPRENVTLEIAFVLPYIAKLSVNWRYYFSFDKKTSTGDNHFWSIAVALKKHAEMLIQTENDEESKII
ncbi:MAG: HEPN domain-containing protein [Firmicutes bacterium]|nr:HEPN domain-containing protein [Bacillota bacterium]